MTGQPRSSIEERGVQGVFTNFGADFILGKWKATRGEVNHSLEE